MSPKTGIILGQLGSPKSPKVSDVRVYLRDFLSDPRVVDLNPLLWKPILYLFVLTTRPKRSAEAYKRIWNGTDFPLVKNTFDLREEFAKSFDESYATDTAFLLPFAPGTQSVEKALDKWKHLEKAVIIPLFPQFSYTTTACVQDQLDAALKKVPYKGELKVLDNWHRSPSFIGFSAKRINDVLSAGEYDHLLISFHGIPKRRVLDENDPYYRHCYETYWLLSQKILPEYQNKMSASFQSRFGREEWLTPYTDETVEELIKNGKKKIAVYCPSFLIDCLETMDEIGNELGEEAKEWGGEVTAIPCINQDPDFAAAWAKEIKTYVETDRPVELEIKAGDVKVPKIEFKSEPLSPKAKSIVKMIFLTLFLDLVGFSIIFPLFPALAKHYLTVDAENIFLKSIFGLVGSLTEMGGAGGRYTPIVLFGGILGALYSLLQFIAAPFWGSLSDKIGRKPVLLVSLTGLAFSYLLWIFSGSFTLLILARFIGGIMAGNISTATAVIADITTEKNRSRGMAFVGIAFAFGFIFGPALGGILSLVNPVEIFPGSGAFGVNPFSAPAALAFILTMVNIFYIWKKFPETLPPEKRGKKIQQRSANPLALFKPLPFKGVNLTNYGHFLFLAAFSGMEFTLTFLAVERLGYSSMDNAYMFIFIGFIIAMVQGGYVRRKAALVGERKMALKGLTFIIPGLVLIGLTKGSGLLYLGLFFLAAGSSMTIPCLTSLVSMYAPAEHQGKTIGVFRSLGALARVVGPIIACLVYWQFGSEMPYYLGAAFLIIPILMVAKLPQPMAKA